jgi:hypothetical protein
MHSKSSSFFLGISALLLAAAFPVACVFQSAPLSAQSIEVRQTEGVVRGFLVLRTSDGTIIANGDSTEVARGAEVTNEMFFHFKDGSVQNETTVFSQTGHFRLVSDHQVQRGPAFKHPMDVLVNAATGVVTVVYKNEKGQDKTETTHLNLPRDIANGLVPTLLKNLAPGTQSTTVSMVVATPKPLLIKLVITDDGKEPFSTGGASHEAIRYRVKVDIGGLRGVLAHLLGKQPHDTLVWIIRGTSPCFLKAEGPGYEDGPIWRTELVSPSWPKSTQR